MEEYNKIERYENERTAFYERLQNECGDNEIISNFFIRFNSPKTMRTYLSAVKSFVSYVCDNGIVHADMYTICLDDFRKIKPSDAIAFFDDYSKNHQSSSVNVYIDMMSSFYSYLEDDYELKNIIKRVPRYKYKTKSFNNEKKYPEEEYIAKMIDNIKNQDNEFLRTRNLAIVEMLKSSGMRINELTDLNVDNVHINNDNVSYVTVIRKGYYNDESCEKVYLANSCINAINDWFKERNDECITTNALFCSTDEKRIGQGTIRKMMKKESDGKVLPHMLRHYYATQLYKNTHDLAFVKSIMGHSYNSDVTENVYINTRTSDNMSILENM